MVKVSVIIPVYNAERHINQCLDSLLNQSLKEIEVICVDDGSTDSSVQIIKEYTEKDGRVKLVQQKNSYAGVARNNGMQIAAGEYMMFLDSDDFFEADMLLEMYEKAVADEADVCLCSARKYNDKTGEYTYSISYLDLRYFPESCPFSAKDAALKLFNIVTPIALDEDVQKELC